jgi:hypothetical protein
LVVVVVVGMDGVMMDCPLLVLMEDRVVVLVKITIHHNFGAVSLLPKQFHLDGLHTEIEAVMD